MVTENPVGDARVSPVPDEYDRFETLARRLVRVPKEELDRKRAEEQRR